MTYDPTSSTPDSQSRRRWLDSRVVVALLTGVTAGLIGSVLALCGVFPWPAVLGTAVGSTIGSLILPPGR